MIEGNGGKNSERNPWTWERGLPGQCGLSSAAWPSGDDKRVIGLDAYP